MLVAALALTAAIEGIVRDELVWRPVALLLGVGLTLTLLWRRSHPLAAVAIAFGAAIVLSVAQLIGADGTVGLNTMVYVVLLPYSLLRWGSGREVGTGLLIILVALVLGLTADYTGVVDSVAASIFLLFPAALGVSVRYWSAAQLRERDQVKLREREQLARELHDTVAHHVTAIAVRAQAGRVLASSEPAAAVGALEVIEEEASRTLAEMRTMVGALRQGEDPALAPQQGVADIQRLAQRSEDGPRVDVQLSGDLADLRSTVGAAIYRLAQESITNAVRHARHASRIDVRVTGDGEWVRLSVRDDGDLSPFGTSPPGYGLLGMTERATLLGGTFEAGPSTDRGWTVTAVLPRNGSRP